MSFAEHPIGNTPPRMISSVLVDIFSRQGLAVLDQQSRHQLHQLAVTRAGERTTDQNNWLRDIWRYKFAGGPFPCWADCWTKQHRHMEPPATLRQTIAEVLGHPDLMTRVSPETVEWARNIARSLHPSKKFAMNGHSSDTFDALWQFLYNNGPAASIRN